MANLLPDNWLDCMEDPAVQRAQKEVLCVLRWDFHSDIAEEGPSRLGMIAREAAPAGVLPVLHHKERKEADGKMRLMLEAYLRSPTFPAEHWYILLGPEVSNHLLGRISYESRIQLIRLAFAHRKHLLAQEMPRAIAGNSVLGLLECQRRLEKMEQHFATTVRRLLERIGH